MPTRCIRANFRRTSSSPIRSWVRRTGTPISTTTTITPCRCGSQCGRPTASTSHPPIRGAKTWATAAIPIPTIGPIPSTIRGPATTDPHQFNTLRCLGTAVRREWILLPRYQQSNREKSNRRVESELDLVSEFRELVQPDRGCNAPLRQFGSECCPTGSVRSPRAVHVYWEPGADNGYYSATRTSMCSVPTCSALTKILFKYVDSRCTRTGRIRKVENTASVCATIA